MAVRLKRAYDPPARTDGYRVLVDRLWPRGVRKDDLRLDDWSKAVAPSDALRRWFGHDPARWTEFQRRYRAELARGAAAEALGTLAARAARGTVTLVFAAHDARHSNAAVLEQLLKKRA
ncbi:MAG TPA: DUF488 domain-containing protein [Polyangia bacterium]|jgi:uncharacterized protein YeaO (DUF488 family)